MTNPLEVSLITTPTLAEVSALAYGQGLGDRAEPRDRAGSGGSAGGGGGGFDAADEGSLPAGWVEFDEFGTVAATVEAVADSLSGYALIVTTDGNNSVKNYVNTNVGPFTKGQVLALFRWASPLAGAGFRPPSVGPCFMSRITGDFGGASTQKNAPGTINTFTQPDFRDIPQYAGAGATTEDVLDIYSDGDRLYRRIYYDTTTDEYKWKVWAVGDAEPASWNIEITSSTYTTDLAINGDSGYVGWGFITGDTDGVDFILEHLDWNDDPTVNIAVPE